MRRTVSLVAALGMAMIVAAAKNGTAEQAPVPESPEEAALLSAVAERPTDPAVFVALTRYYYDERRLELAVRTLTAALAVSRADTRPLPPSPTPGVYRAGIDVPLPVKTNNEAPRLDRDTLQAGAVGVVVLEAVIDRDGRVQEPRVVQSVPMLDEPVVEAARRWRYEPTIVNGQAVSVTALLAADVTFRTDPEPDRDLALAEFYLSAFIYPQAEFRLARALSAVRAERQCFGPDGGVASRLKVEEIRDDPSRAEESFGEPPVKIHDVRPLYPSQAQAALVQGLVIIDAYVNHDGGVQCARVLKSVPMLDQAAIDAVRQWRYEPYLHDGKPAAVLMTVTVNFSLSGRRP